MRKITREIAEDAVMSNINAMKTGIEEETELQHFGTNDLEKIAETIYKDFQESMTEYHSTKEANFDGKETIINEIKRQYEKCSKEYKIKKGEVKKDNTASGLSYETCEELAKVFEKGFRNVLGNGTITIKIVKE